MARFSRGDSVSYYWARWFSELTELQEPPERVGGRSGLGEPKMCPGLFCFFLYGLLLCSLILAGTWALFTE